MGKEGVGVEGGGHLLYVTLFAQPQRELQEQLGRAIEAIAYLIR